VIDVVEFEVGEEFVDKTVVGNGATHEMSAVRHVVFKPSTQVIKDDHLLPEIEAMPRYM
jgi:hypothetical protein